VGFDSHAEAERLANSLQEISHKPEIVVLRLSCYDNGLGYIEGRPTRAALMGKRRTS